MTDTIMAGSILVEHGTQLPSSLLLQNESLSNGWAPVKEVGSKPEKEIQGAGWTFFFMAGQIEATSFGFDGQKTLGAALSRLTKNATAQHCNSIEITRVARKSFLKLPYVTVSAHTRHFQKGLGFSRLTERAPIRHSSHDSI
jgi:hypothetical protein